jgi:GNAT superfamily N-acetyltransferase
MHPTSIAITTGDTDSVRGTEFVTMTELGLSMGRPCARLNAWVSSPSCPWARGHSRAAADVPAIVGLLADDELGATREAGSDPELTSYRTAFAAIDADPGHLLLVVTAADGQVAATMQLTFIPGLARQGALRAQIEAVRVGAGYRSQGLGEAMITWGIAEARRRGCRMVQLTSDSGARTRTASTSGSASPPRTRASGCRCDPAGRPAAAAR